VTTPRASERRGSPRVDSAKLVGPGTHPNRLVLTSFDPIDDLSLQLNWLGRADFASQPYEELARVLRHHGYARNAVKLLIAGEKRRLKDQTIGIPAQAWGWLLRLTVGFGYRPGQALVWLAGFWFVGWWVFANAGSCQLMLRAPKSASDSTELGTVEAAIYSLDTLLPIVNLGLRDVWYVSKGSPFVWAYWRIHVLAGWLFSTLAVLGLTGLVRRRD
jgi:hypothetical protein